MLKKTSIVLFFILIAVTHYIAGQSESEKKPEIGIKYGPKGWIKKKYKTSPDFTSLYDFKTRLRLGIYSTVTTLAKFRG